MAERVYCLYRGKDQESILMQKNTCYDFVEKKGWNIVGEEQEIGVSGYKVSADDRALCSLRRTLMSDCNAPQWFPLRHPRPSGIH